MKSGGERTIIAVAIAISLLLTTVTVWSVAAQGRAIEQRERGELESQASAGAVHARELMTREIESVFFNAELAYQGLRSSGVNFWAASQRRWPLIFFRDRGGAWERFPTPGARTVPAVGEAASAPVLPAERDAAARLAERAEEVRAALTEINSAAPAEGVAVAHLPALGAVLLRHAVGGDAEAVICTTPDALLARFAQFPSDAAFEVVPPGAIATRPVLAPLGGMFGDAKLQATAAAAALLRKQSLARWRFVLMAAAGTLAAWALLLWLMRRLWRQQADVVKLQRRIVADVSHELKTPLALVRLHAETLRAGRVRDPNRQNEYLDTIIRESERLTVLLDSILDFSKLERGQRDYRFGDCDLPGVARQAWALYEPQFTSAGFDARCELPQAGLQVHADGHALQQVMVNLLQNAFRYSRERKWVRLRVRGEGFLAFIEVEDKGIGMSRDHLKELGASFVRGPDPRVRDARGTGLGLAIVNRIVEAHGGKLEVESTPDMGSKFTIWLPRDGSKSDIPAG
ncbi:MAG: HAMP domain-containing sensor histidine kinase [Phycisphaerae bacterium]|nr:HAMP domain-containing sensor histidine kinase [Phycisphaerae bacterium]